MIHYLCELCGTAFDEPRIHTYLDQTVDCRAVIRESLCPACGQPYIVQADLCPKCETPKPEDQRLCRGCMGSLIRRFCAFADELTADEEEALDDLLDGESVTTRQRWREAYGAGEEA